MRSPNGSSIALLFTALLAAALAGCGTDSGVGDEASSAGPDDPCVPGQSLACTCAGGSPGAQVCEPDGIGYGPCSCEGADDGTDEGAEVGSVGEVDGGPGADASDDGGGEGDAGEDSGNDGPGESGSAGDSGGLAGVPSWTNDIVPILNVSCGAGVSGCHTREAYNAVVDKGCINWVSYENVPLGSVFYSGENAGQPTGCPDLPLYERIVNRSPWQCGAFFGDPQAVIVKPGAPEESYMMQKIMGFTCDPDTTAMPPPEQPIQITQTQIDTLSAWIAAGAPYDG